MTTAITITGASVSPVSGEPIDFTSPVTYTVTAEDGTTQDYTVTINVAAAGAFIVTFDANGGIPAAAAAITAPGGGTVSLPSPNPTKSGFTFDSWNTAQDGSGTAFDGTTVVTASITVYAKWTNAGSGYTISGTIWANSPAGPLAGASAQLKQGAATLDTMTTAEGGTYAFFGVAAGSYTIQVSKSGYDSGSIATFTVSGNVSGKNLTLTASTVTNAAVPVIGTQPVGAIYAKNASPVTALTVAASISDSGSGGALTYQWYSNTVINNSTGTSLGSANGARTASYTPSTAAVGTIYYYVVITNTNNSVSGTKTATATSNVAAVTINATVGEITWTFSGLPEDETSALINSGNTLSWTANTALIVGVPNTFSSYTWFVDGTPISGTTSMITLYARNYALGSHTVSVRVVKDGMPYSKSLSFTIGE
jgi:uncharacterized repeat protein (TIGR02543 family)